jgi:hypothetical protein
MANKMAADNPKKRMNLSEAKRKLDKRLQRSLKHEEPKPLKMVTC